VRSSYLGLLPLLAACSLAGCASTAADNDIATTTAEVSASTVRYEITSFELDPILVAGAPTGITSGTVHLDPVAGTLKAILVFDLFPDFYETKIVRSYTDDCGRLHHEGTSDVHPDWPDTLIKIHLVDPAGSRCADADAGPQAELRTVRQDGRETHSVLGLWRHPPPH
jgi:hypothetical protein